VHTVLFAVGYDRQSGRSQREVMVDGLANVLLHFRPRCARFITISSTSVYGQQHGEWVDETSPCNPRQPGGQCCLAAEQLLEPASPSHVGNRVQDDPSPEPMRDSGSAAETVILRLAGIYGPGRLLARIEALQRGEPIAGRHDAWLNLIHVDDAVAVLRAVESCWQAGQTYLVCDDRPVTRGEYYSTLAQLVGAPPPHFDESQSPRRGSGGLNKRCSNRKLRDSLQARLQYPTYREGLPAAI
jgi:nucleoside-diphosphate-sugar epimerase